MHLEQNTAVRKCKLANKMNQTEAKEIPRGLMNCNLQLIAANLMNYFNNTSIMSLRNCILEYKTLTKSGIN